MLRGAQWLLKKVQPHVGSQAIRAVPQFQYLAIPGNLAIAQTKTSCLGLFDKPLRCFGFYPTRVQRAG